MNVKVNDNVLVIAGKDKGVQGKVLATSPKANTVIVEGVRVQKKHEKARKANETSKIVEAPGPIDASNVKVVCPSCGKATRVKHAVVDGKKVSDRHGISKRIVLSLNVSANNLSLILLVLSAKRILV